MNILLQFLLLHKKLILVAVPSSLVVILVVITSFAPQSQQKEGLTVTEAPLPTIFKGRSVASAQSVIPPLAFSKSGAEKMIDLLQNKQPLVQEDLQAKSALLAKLGAGGSSGQLFRNSFFRVEYIYSMDIFMVEITNKDIGIAKKMTVDWFTDQGFSEISICTMPVVFYLNSEIAQELRPLNMTFSPLAEGCT